MANQESMPGGWSECRKVTPEDVKVFNEAVVVIGVEYTPISVMSQVVAGVNYVFLADAKVVSPEAKSYKVVVKTFKPLDGPAEKAKIIDL